MKTEICRVNRLHDSGILLTKRDLINACPFVEIFTVVS